MDNSTTFALQTTDGGQDTQIEGDHDELEGNLDIQVSLSPVFVYRRF
jgi:hypothetical protein